MSERTGRTERGTTGYGRPEPRTGTGPRPEPLRFFGTTWVDHDPGLRGYTARRAAVSAGSLVAAALGYGVGSVMYPGTRVLMGGITAAYVLVPLIYRQQVARAALAAPQWCTAVAGSGFWVFLDVMWKLYHAPRVHEAPAMVAVHLGLGLAGLVMASWALGWLARRTAWLHPAPTGGQ